MKIHEDMDRRQTKSSIEFGSDGDSVKDHGEVNKESTEDEGSKDGDIEEEEDDDVGSMGGGQDRDYQYSYGGRDPGQKYFTYTNGRDRSMSIVSTISKNDWRGGPSKDYQYSYGDEVYVDRPRKVSERSSVERQQRNSVDRKQETGKGNRQSQERKVERQRQSEERYRPSSEQEEKYRKSEERQKQSWEKNREPAPDRDGHGDRGKHAEKEEHKRRVEREEDDSGDDEVLHKESPDCPDRYKEGHEFKPRLRVNVNRRKQESRARGGDYTGSNYY